jgi:simple sugar transport system permease protein
MDISSVFNDWLLASVRMAAPLILLGVGGVFTERSGVFNIGMEGMMLVGAMAAVAGDLATGSVWVGTICAMVAGGLLSVVHAYLTVTRRANQIVSGATINLFALGITNLLFGPLYEGYKYRPRAPLYPKLAPPAWQEIPILGPVFLAQPVIVWIAFALPLIATWVLYRTSWGLNLRAVGDNPHAVATAGVSVFRLKYTGVILSGVLAGLAGSALVLAELGIFGPNLTAGRGFIALAALAVGNWHPTRVAGACLFFGAAEALQLRAQTWSQVIGVNIPHQFLVMLPYLLTIAALAGLVGKTVAPKTAGKPYEPEVY